MLIVWDKILLIRCKLGRVHDLLLLVQARLKTLNMGLQTSYTGLVVGMMHCIWLVVGMMHYIGLIVAMLFYTGLVVRILCGCWEASCMLRQNVIVRQSSDL